MAINTLDVTRSGADYSKAIDLFQQQTTAHAQAEADHGSARYRLIVALVTVGVLISLGLIGAVHFALRALIVAPLAEAANLLHRVADGDLTIHISSAGENEVGQLHSAIARMKSGLAHTVRQVLGSSDSVNLGPRKLPLEILTSPRGRKSSPPHWRKPLRACRS